MAYVFETVPADRSLIDIDDPREVNWWRKRFECSEEQQRGAAAAGRFVGGKFRGEGRTAAGRQQRRHALALVHPTTVGHLVKGVGVLPRTGARWVN
jgi:hypothetical protein